MIKKKGQGSFEYVLLLAGILVIVVLAFVMIRGTFGSADRQTQEQECKRKLVMDLACYYSEQDKIDGIIPMGKDVGDWDPCGEVVESKYNEKDSAGDWLIPPLCASYDDSCAGVGYGPDSGKMFCDQPPK